MKTNEYYNHCRSLGNFTAQDCLELARQAAELDRKAEQSKVLAPVVVWHESLPDGSNNLRLSSGVKCF